MPTTSKRPSNPEMQVTSIRLELDLKERLRSLSDEQGYQALIRNILWQYVRQHDLEQRTDDLRSTLRATLPAIAQRPERCALTGVLIQPNQPMFLGLTQQGDWLPLSQESLSSSR